MRKPACNARAITRSMHSTITTWLAWTWPRLREPSENTSTNEKTNPAFHRGSGCGRSALDVAHGTVQPANQPHSRLRQPGTDAGRSFLQDRRADDGAHRARGRFCEEGTAHRAPGPGPAPAAARPRPGIRFQCPVQLRSAYDFHRISKGHD